MDKTKAVILGALLSFSPYFPKAMAGPVPCDTALSALERLVCSDGELRSLDELVYRLYEDALRGASGATSVSGPHEEWQRERRDKCADVSCLKEAYYSRLDALDGFASARRDKAGTPFFVGTWKREDHSGFDPADLEVSAETDSAFAFSFYAESGARSGAFAGSAEKQGPGRATYDGHVACRIDFTLLLSGKLSVAETGCQDLGGVGVAFTGSYRLGEGASKGERLFLKNEICNASLRTLAGEDYPLFLSTAHLPREVLNLDDFNGVVQAFQVRGLAGVKESIVICRSDGALWAAVTRPVDGENLEPAVLYFSNQKDWESTLPKTIESWRTDFSDFKVHYMSMGGLPSTKPD